MYKLLWKKTNKEANILVYFFSQYKEKEANLWAEKIQIFIDCGDC